MPLTQTRGAALAPAPAPDGSGLFFLSLEPDGFDLRRLPLIAGAAAEVLEPRAELPVADLIPALPLPAPAERPAPFVRAEVAPGVPYGTGRQELLPLIGGSSSSTGGLVELGLRGGDVVGRLDWLALGSIGQGGWPEGGALALAWRGWPVEAGLHVFKSSERPTEEETVAARGDRLDLDREGFELWTRREWLWGRARLDARARALWNRIETVDKRGELDQHLGSLTVGWTGLRRWGDWRLDPAVGLHAETGRTTGAGSWTRWGGGVRAGISYEDTQLGLTWRRDSSHDVRFPWDAYQLGGPEVSLLPGSALANRIFAPALPVGAWLGAEHESQRAELELGFLPAPLFWERHRLWDYDNAKGDWLSLAGLEYRFRLGPLPIGRLPALDLRVGVARILDDPLGEFEDSTRWWMTTVWRP